jgi:hypothetical protein
MQGMVAKSGWQNESKIIWRTLKKWMAFRLLWRGQTIRDGIRNRGDKQLPIHARHFFTGRGLTLRQKSGWLGGSHNEFTQTNA